MPNYILRVEGVDFAATIDDTHNLSAYRGGSLALLAAPRAAEKFLAREAGRLHIRFDKSGWDENDAKSALPARVFAAASQGAWRIEAADGAAAERARGAVEELLRSGAGDPVFPYLSFVVDVAPGGDLAALKQAEANGHERQLLRANWEPPQFDPEARGGSVRWDEEEKKWKPIPLDPMRPATVECHVKTQKVKVSPSFKARFEYGRNERQNFYKREAGASKANGLDFAESFEDIIKEAPKGLPASISGKIAVFYADGNKFTKIRDQSKSVAELRDFSEKLLQYQRGMLGELLDWLRAGGASQYGEAYLQYPRTKGKAGPFWPLRFETLQWGGDELTFVMPAWLGIEFAQKFFDNWTKEWRAPTGEPLTFGASLLFCHEKTPIRQARKMAKIMAEDAKSTLDGALEHVLQIEAFESIAMPEWEHGLERYRAKMFGTVPRASWLTLQAGEISKTFDRIKEMKNGGFPRSQLYWLLRKACDEEIFLLAVKGRASANEKLAREARAYFKRKGLDADEQLPKLNIVKEAPLAFSLAAAAALWDYADPLAHMEAAGAAEAAE